MMERYQIIESQDGIRVSGIQDFQLDHIFDCGQCFRWEKNRDGSYSGIVRGHFITAGYEPEAGPVLNGRKSGILTLSHTTAQEFRDIWYDYFDLGRDYRIIKDVLRKDDPVMEKAIAYGEGIRILNQEPWETLLSFLISQNNNIPRIKKCIKALAQTLGKPVSIHGASGGASAVSGLYRLPDPEVLADCTVEDLAPCRLGYRAKYLIQTAKQVKQRGVRQLNDLARETISPQQAREALQEYAGVGPKVAGCIALFSMKKFSSFPIDVWVRKVMHQLYGLPEKDVKAMEAFAAEHFGPYGGIAQQYLFYYITHLA